MSATTPTHAPPPTAAAPGAPRTEAGLGRLATLTVHLVRRDVAATNRTSIIGAAWPLLRQLAQMAVLVFVFSKLLDLGIPDYPVYVFAGLIGWSWFVAGVGMAAWSMSAHRELAMRPFFPSVILPVVDVAVPFVDVLVALPVLVVVLAVTDEVRLSIVLLLPLLALQGVFMVGLAWLTASVTVFLRDIPQLVNVVLLMGFYVTPVYFDISRIPDRYEWILRLNPMATFLEADRAVLLGTPFPAAGTFLGVAAASFAVLGIGLLVFRRLAPSFADEL